MDFGTLTVLGVIVVLAIVVAFSSLRIANEYERGVVFRLGRLIDLRGPGLFFIIPFGVDRLVKVDLRVITLEVPPQESSHMTTSPRRSMRSSTSRSSMRAKQ